MRQLIAGNWKMNGMADQLGSIARPIAVAAESLACDILLCPPATLVAWMSQALTGSSVAVGGQDCHAAASGAHTGDIAAEMLREAGATWVILGHSERRADHGETDADVRAKTAAAARAGLAAIVCVGETADQRSSGQALPVVAAQLAGSLPDDFAGVVAYEPIWAIGTGRTATETDVAEMHAHIRATLKELLGLSGAGLRILYGGSVKPGNAAGLLAVPNVGGALVGGASLDAADFLAIARAARTWDGKGETGPAQGAGATE
jgi:triosephosphate isomerase